MRNTAWTVPISRSVWRRPPSARIHPYPELEQNGDPDPTPKQVRPPRGGGWHGVGGPPAMCWKPPGIVDRERQWCSSPTCLSRAGSTSSVSPCWIGRKNSEVVPALRVGKQRCKMLGSARYVRELRCLPCFLRWSLGQAMRGIARSGSSWELAGGPVVTVCVHFQVFQAARIEYTRACVQHS